MSLEHVSYERLPPIGNTLIDDDAGSVFIRIFPDRTMGRAASWFFAFCGVVVLAFAMIQMEWTRVGALRSGPILFLGALFFLLAMTMRYSPVRRVATIHATPRGIEFAAGGFAPR